MPKEVLRPLGRGGSDYTTASLLEQASKLMLIEIWTDVDGVLTADPRLVSKAFYDSKTLLCRGDEMSHFGKK